MLKIKLPQDIFYSIVEIKDSHIKQLTAEEVKSIGQVSEKRLVQFASGRLAAKQALLSAGYNEGKEFQILSLDGLPIWHDNFVGTISHSNKYALACVASKSNYHNIGVDIEELDRDFSSKILRRIATPTEIEGLNLENSKQNILALFCAKEALYKALFPVKKVFFGFHSAELSWQIEGQVFKAVLKSEISKIYGNETFKISIQKSGSCLIAICLWDRRL